MLLPGVFVTSIKRSSVDRENSTVGELTRRLVLLAALIPTDHVICDRPLK